MSESSTQTPAGSQPRATRGFSQITIRMSDSLYDQMEQARGGRSRNAYVVSLIDGGVRVAGLPGQPRAKAAKKTRARLEEKAAQDAAGPEVAPPITPEEEPDKTEDDLERERILAGSDLSLEQCLVAQGYDSFLLVFLACHPYASVADVDRRLGASGWEDHLARLVELGLIEVEERSGLYRPAPRDPAPDVSDEAIARANEILRGGRDA